jgi:hypothetical protein
MFGPVLSGKKVVNAAKEAAWSGYDVKFSGQAPYLPWAKICPVVVLP